jgi:hypothetical protein
MPHATAGDEHYLGTVLRRAGRLTATLAITVLMVLTLSAAGDEPSSAAPAPPADEYATKALFLQSFGRYVKWPESAMGDGSAPFVIGILGKDSFSGALDEIAAKKTIQDRRIEVRRFASVDNFRQPCHILFVSRSVPIGQQRVLLAKTKGKPVLVAGETPGFAERGAAANFFADEGHIRFEINVATARQAHLRLDAKLLSLGKLVGNQRPPTRGEPH